MRLRTKRASTQAGEHKKAQVLIRHLSKYSLAALNAEIVRLQLVLRGRLFTVPIKE